MIATLHSDNRGGLFTFGPLYRLWMAVKPMKHWRVTIFFGKIHLRLQSATRRWLTFLHKYIFGKSRSMTQLKINKVSYLQTAWTNIQIFPIWAWSARSSPNTYRLPLQNVDVRQFIIQQICLILLMSRKWMSNGPFEWSVVLLRSCIMKWITEDRFLFTKLMALIMCWPSSTQHTAWSSLATGSPATQ